MIWSFDSYGFRHCKIRGMNLFPISDKSETLNREVRIDEHFE